MPSLTDSIILSADKDLRTYVCMWPNVLLHWTTDIRICLKGDCKSLCTIVWSSAPLILMFGSMYVHTLVRMCMCTYMPLQEHLLPSRKARQLILTPMSSSVCLYVCRYVYMSITVSYGHLDRSLEIVSVAIFMACRCSTSPYSLLISGFRLLPTLRCNCGDRLRQVSGVIFYPRPCQNPSKSLRTTGLPLKMVSIPESIREVADCVIVKSSPSVIELLELDKGHAKRVGNADCLAYE